METAKLQGQVRSHPLRQQDPLLKPPNYCHRRPRGCHYDLQRPHFWQATPTSRTPRYPQSCSGQEIRIVNWLTAWQSADASHPAAACPDCHTGLGGAAWTSCSNVAKASVEGLEVGLHAQGLEAGRMVQEAETKLDIDHLGWRDQLLTQQVVADAKVWCWS